jgi:hypothetical protein
VRESLLFFCKTNYAKELKAIKGDAGVSGMPL